MLTTVQRLIARDILVMFGLSLTVLTTVMMLVGVAREALNQGLGVADVIRLLPFIAPNALSFAVPGTALFSVCCVYGRMSADNELTAIQSVGVSPLPAMMPAIVITTLLSIATVGLINVAFTWGFHGIRNVVLSSIETIAYGVLEKDHVFQHGPLTLTVRDVDGKRLLSPEILIHRAAGDTISISAREATLGYDDENQLLNLSITDGSAHFSDEVSFRFPDTLVQSVPLNTRPPYDLLTANPSHMPMRDLPAAAIQQRNDIQKLETELAIRTGFGILAARYDQISTISDQAFIGIENSRRRLNRLQVETQRRWASGFTCLALSLVGIPLAIRLKTADPMTTFGIVFLPTLIFYYPLFAVTLDLAKDGRLGAIGVWIANAIFLCISLIMMRKTIYAPA